jgi:hypothetical protein
VEISEYWSRVYLSLEGRLAARKSPGPVTEQEFVSVRKALGAAKVDSAVEWIRMFTGIGVKTPINGEGRKLVAFTVHVDVAKSIWEALRPNSVLVTGEQTPEARDAAIQQFCSSPAVLAYVGTVEAGGVGINLQSSGCTDVLFVERTWTPASNHQAEDRVHRVGTVGSVMVYTLLARLRGQPTRPTVDHHVEDVLASKQRAIDGAVDGVTPESGPVTPDAILERLRSTRAGS